MLCYKPEENKDSYPLSGGGCPPSYYFYWKCPIQANVPYPLPLPLTEKQIPHWKVKPPSRKWFPQKKQKKSETVIKIQNFVRKVKQFVGKHYITWLIDLANKFYDRKTLDFISCHFLLKLVLFYQEIL